VVGRYDHHGHHTHPTTRLEPSHGAALATAGPRDDSLPGIAQPTTSDPRSYVGQVTVGPPGVTDVRMSMISSSEMAKRGAMCRRRRRSLRSTGVRRGTSSWRSTYSRASPSTTASPPYISSQVSQGGWHKVAGVRLPGPPPGLRTPLHANQALGLVACQSTSSDPVRVCV
jgi:hypothetical protein